jgi:serine/threonine-protein kinase
VSEPEDESKKDFAKNIHGDCDLSRVTTSVGLGGEIEGLGLGDALNKNLAELAGASADAIRLLEGRFSVCSELGSGGMGEVFTANDTVLNREIAVKVLPNKSSAGLARFVREAQITAQLSHPNVVPVYGLEETDQGNAALTMKLIRGDTFAEYIKQCEAAMGTRDYDHKRHGQSGRIEHFLRVCDAISYSHSRGVVHRDLKPENLMLGDYGEVYVMDWGIARLLGESEDGASFAQSEASSGSENISVDYKKAKTRVGAIMGTPRYMPPEQMGSDDVGPKSDQFALGMVLFEMLTYCTPRKITGMNELIEKVYEGYRHCFAEVKQTEPVPLALQAIVNRATEKDPADRYPSVEEFSDDLRRFVHGEEVRARPDNFVRALWRRVRHRPIAVMSALLIALSTAAAVSTISLYRGLEAERLSSIRGQTLAALVAQVTQRANDFDTLLFQVEGLLEGVATSSREQLQYAPEQPYQIYQPADLKGDNAPADLANIQRYQQRVSFNEFVAVLPPGVELDSVRSELFQLGGLKSVLRDTLLRSERIDASELKKEEADAILVEGTPIHWSYVCLENGTLLNYPGNEEYPVDYDARKRPWYVEAISKKHGANWGVVYADATGSGYLVTCNQPFYDQTGKLLGVAGVDLAMDTVIEQMNMLQLGGLRKTYLMDDSGSVVVSSEEKGRKTAISIGENKTKERSSLGIPELEEHVRKGTTSGFVIVGKEVLVFARLKGLPWTLVGRVEGRSHGL